MSDSDTINISEISHKYKVMDLQVYAICDRIFTTEKNETHRTSNTITPPHSRSPAVLFS